MMKKIISITVLSIAALFLTVSCHDPIFYMISQEVVQEEGLQGDINSMVKFKDGNLYVANGKIYKKTATPSSSTGQYNGQWSESSTSGINGFVFFLAADNSNLYALAYQFTADNDKSLNRPSHIRLYASSNGSSWTQVNISTLTGLGDASDSYGQGAARIFDNKGTSAYIRLYNGETPAVYKLNGTGVPTSTSAPANSLGAANTQFWTSPAICYANSKYYFAHNSKTLYYSSTGTSDTSHSVELDCGDIQSIAATSDYLILGTNKGIARVKLNSSGEPESHITNFPNNAESLVTGIVPMVFVLDPTQPEGHTDEYASMTVGGSLSSSPDTFDETGLYAFYPSRGGGVGVWNRDGD